MVDFESLKKMREQDEDTIATIKNFQETLAVPLTASAAFSEFLNNPTLRMIGGMAEDMRRQIEIVTRSVAFQDATRMQGLVQQVVADSQRRTAESMERSRELSAEQDALIESMAASREAMEDRIAEKVARKLKPEFPVDKKPPIGFGDPEK